MACTFSLTRAVVTFPTKKPFWLSFHVNYRMLISHVTGMMTIEVTPSHTRRHTQRHFAKSISTDGTEGKLTRNIQVTTEQHWDLFIQFGVWLGARGAPCGHFLYLTRSQWHSEVREKYFIHKKETHFFGILKNVKCKVYSDVRDLFNQSNPRYIYPVWFRIPFLQQFSEMSVW